MFARRLSGIAVGAALATAVLLVSAGWADNPKPDPLSPKPPVPETLSNETQISETKLDNIELEGSAYMRSSGTRRIPTERCRRACLQDRRCKGYTSYGNTSCVLFDRIESRSKVAVGATSGLLSHSARSDGTRRSGSVTSTPKLERPQVVAVLKCPQGFATRRDIEVIGGNLNLRGLAVPIDQCAVRCQNKKRCRGFIWLTKQAAPKRDARCILKARFPVVQKRSGLIVCAKE